MDDENERPIWDTRDGHPGGEWRWRSWQSGAHRRHSTDRRQTWRRWPHGDHGPWILGFTWQLINGRWECIGIETRSMLVKPHPVSALLMREIPFASVIDEERFRIASWYRDHGQLGDTSSAHFSELSQRWSRPARPGRKQVHNPAEVAEVYTQAYLTGAPPTKAVAERLGISHSAASKQVARARALGLIEPTTRGRPAARPTQQPTEENP